MPKQDSIANNIDSTSQFSLLPAFKKIDVKEASEKLNYYIKDRFNWSDASIGKRVDRNASYWQFSVLIILLILFVIIRIGYINRYRQLLEAVSSMRYMRQVIREELALSHPFSLFLLSNFSFSCGLLIYFLLDYYNIQPWGFNGVLLFFLLSVGVLLLLFSKTIVLDLFRFLIGDDGGQNENRYTFLMFYQVTGIVLLPICVLASFGPEYLHFPSFISGLVLIAVVYLVRLGRGIVIGFNYGSGVVYIFLYLCALELAPLIVSIKLLMREIG